MLTGPGYLVLRRLQEIQWQVSATEVATECGECGGRGSENPGGRIIRSGQHDRDTLVASLAQSDAQWHARPQRHRDILTGAEPLGPPCTTACTDESHRGSTAGRNERRHCLDDTDNVLAGLSRENTGTFGDLGSGRLRCRHDDDFGVG